MRELKISTSRDNLMKFFLLCIIWYVEFFVRYFQFPNALLLLGGLMILFFFLDYFSGGRSLVRPFPKAFTALMVYELYTIVFGFIVAPDVKTHLNQAIIMIEYTLTFIVIVYYAKKNNNIEFLIWNYAVMYSLMCVIFLYKPVWYLENALFKRLSFAATMNPNSFAICLVTGAWSLLYLAMQKKISLVLALIGTGLDTYAIFLSGSRKGLGGILIVLSLWLVFCYIPNTDPHKPLTKILKGIAAILIAIALLYILLPYYSDSILAKRMLDLSGEATEGARNEMYVRGWEYFKRSPVFGYGLQGFKYFYGGYSHATLVEVPVTGGIIGTVMYFFFYIEIFIGLWKGVKNNIKDRSNTISFIRPRMGLILFIAMLFYSIAMIHIYEIGSYMYFAMIIATYTVFEDRSDNTTIWAEGE